MCRKRLSIWLRRNKDFSLLIDENLWNQIQKYYKKEVDQKLFDQDDGVWENCKYLVASNMLFIGKDNFLYIFLALTYLQHMI